MYAFGRRSLQNLNTCDTFLQKVLIRAMSYQLMDFAIICGHRDEAAQNRAFNSRNSKKRWPDSKHNHLPSIAVDVAPWPIDWNDHLAFARLYGIIEAASVEVRGAEGSDTKLRWGGDWDGDGESNDQSFMDIGHFEMVKAPTR